LLAARPLLRRAALIPEFATGPTGIFVSPFLYGHPNSAAAVDLERRVQSDRPRVSCTAAGYVENPISRDSKSITSQRTVELIDAQFTHWSDTLLFARPSLLSARRRGFAAPPRGGEYAPAEVLGRLKAPIGDGFASSRSTGALYFGATAGKCQQEPLARFPSRAGINPVMTKMVLVSWRDILTLLVLAVVLAAAVAFGLWLATLLAQWGTRWRVGHYLTTPRPHHSTTHHAASKTAAGRG
jgi:hypothetical protein